MMLKWVDRSFVLSAVSALLVFPSYFSSSFAAQKEKPKKSVNVIELRRIDQLKQAFQLDTGKVRFVTILSPT